MFYFFNKKQNFISNEIICTSMMYWPIFTLLWKLKYTKNKLKSALNLAVFLYENAHQIPWNYQIIYSRVTYSMSPYLSFQNRKTEKLYGKKLEETKRRLLFKSTIQIGKQSIISAQFYLTSLNFLIQLISQHRQLNDAANLAGLE